MSSRGKLSSFSLGLMSSKKLSSSSPSSSSISTFSTIITNNNIMTLRSTEKEEEEESEYEEEPAIRIGHGYDIHRLIEGTPLVIGGVTIPFKLGADAHSDGDAIYHSIVDAILGALTLPDIGELFPDNDPQHKGADSSIFMEEAYRRMIDRGYRIGNVDVTLILQAPKVKDLKPLMKANIMRLLRTTPDRVNVKARTHEKVDSVGEGRAYEVHVVVLLEKTKIR